MSLKQEIETWVQALAHYDNNEYEESLTVFDNIADTSKILFNCGVIHATLGEHDKAVECFQRAVRLDQYFAVAYFQQGVSNFLVGDFEEALANFNDTLLYLRGNNYIDYEQLGLKFKLYSCEVLFNRGLCYIYLQQDMPGMKDFEFAKREKMTPDHDVIDDAIKERAEGYTVFSIPVGVVYRPNDAKVKNLKTKDYLGKARLVAAADKSNAFTGFAGAEIKAKLNTSPLIGTDDRMADSIPFATSSLVDRTLSSRGRQQSEPPMNRNVFPPTPPPEADKLSNISSDNGSVKDNAPPAMTGRAASVRNANARPLPGQLGPLRRANTDMNGFDNRGDTNNFPPRQDNGFPPRQENGFPPARNENRPPPPGKDPRRPMGDPMRGPMDDRMGGPMDRMNQRLDPMRGNMGDSMRDDQLGMLPRTQYGSNNRQLAGSPPTNNVMNNAMNGAERPRLGTMRAASEPRGPSGPSGRYSNTRNRDAPSASGRRPGLFREMTDESQMSTNNGRMMTDPYGQPVEQDEYRDELFDMYSSPPSSRNQPPGVRRTRSTMQSSRGNYDIPEEPAEMDNEAYASDAYSDASIDDNFDMVGQSNRPGMSRTRSRRPIEVTKIRVKVHANDDTRYIMIGPDISMQEFEMKVQEKFKMRGRVRIKVQDDGDMVTLADQDDLEVIIATSKSAARRTGEGMGKMEIWIVGM